MADKHRLIPPGSLGEDLKGFWRGAAAEQDRINILTRSPEWFEMMSENRPNSTVSVCLSDDGEAQGVLPLIPAKSPWGHDILKAVGGEIIAVGGMPIKDLSFWIDELFASFHAEQAIFFDHMTESQLANLQSAAQTSQFRVCVERRRLVHHRLVLPEAREDLKRLHSTRTAQKIRNAERRVRDLLGAVRLLEFRNYEHLLPIAPQIEKMMNSTWQARRLGHSFALRDLKPVSDRGWLRCFALKGNERVIAFVACYQGMGTIVYEIIGYDERYAKYSPGKVLLHRLLEKLYDEDTPKYLDYGEGVAEYKKGSANDSIEINRVYLLPSVSFDSVGIDLRCLRSRAAMGLKALLEKKNISR